jgi:very-short-patch-repair endonuclease
MVCSKCGKRIGPGVFGHSVSKYGKPLCMNCQPQTKASYVNSSEPSRLILMDGHGSLDPKITPEARRLGEILLRKGWPVEFEKWDGHKHIDIAIVEAKVNIEVDGPLHNLSTKHALSDLKRTYHSFRKGFVTLRIPNCLVTNSRILQETADFIDEFLRESEAQVSESW